MTEVAIIGIDLAKRVFQAHGAAANGAVVFRKKLTRDRLMIFLATQPRCISPSLLRTEPRVPVFDRSHGFGRSRFRTPRIALLKAQLP